MTVNFSTTSSTDDCVICHETMKKKDSVGHRVSDVTHVFHRTCLKKWAVQKSNCPSCRGDFNPYSLMSAKEQLLAEIPVMARDALCGAATWVAYGNGILAILGAGKAVGVATRAAAMRVGVSDRVIGAVETTFAEVGRTASASARTYLGVGIGSAVLNVPGVTTAITGAAIGMDLASRYPKISVFGPVASAVIVGIVDRHLF